VERRRVKLFWRCSKVFSRVAMAVRMANILLFAEDEPNEEQEDDSDDEPINPLVDALFDEVEDLRMQVGALIPYSLLSDLFHFSYLNRK